MPIYRDAILSTVDRMKFSLGRNILLVVLY